MRAIQCETGLATHVGKVRQHNEDRIHVDTQRGLFVVADGMGGHGGGDVASELAAHTIASRFAAGATLEQAVADADAAIVAARQEGQGSPGMGTTIVAMVLWQGRFRLAWVGDSRAYRLRGHLEQLSRDHSQVQELLNQGLISPEQASTHPRRHVITRAVGRLQGDTIGQIDSLEGALEPGDVFVLCSDGLTGPVAEAKIESIVRAASGAQPAAEDLQNAALEAGGPDNVSVIVIRVLEGV